MLKASQDMAMAKGQNGSKIKIMPLPIEIKLCLTVDKVFFTHYY